MGLPAPSAPTERTLYLYENLGVQAAPVAERALYQFENIGLQATSVTERTLYLYESLGIQALALLERALYEVENLVTGTLFPWLWKLSPGRQYQGGQVSLYGDGFGDTQVADGSTVYLNGEAMGVVSWETRSPGLWPANGGIEITPALVVTVPVDGVSGMVKVEETVP